MVFDLTIRFIKAGEFLGDLFLHWIRRVYAVYYFACRLLLFDADAQSLKQVSLNV